MGRVGPTMRIAASVTGLLLAASAAQAIPSIAIKWRSTGTATIASPAATSTQIADIVITTVTQTVNGIFISIEFDNVELTAIAANEIARVNLPGMGNEFTPVTIGTTIDNASGLVTLFDQHSLTTGLAGGHVRTLGSVTFHIVAAIGTSFDIDVIASLQNSFVDGVFNLTESIGANFVGAAAAGPPEDYDLDGVDDAIDNCEFLYNPGQEDTNGNGIGDVCEVAVPSSSLGVRLFLTLALLLIGQRWMTQPRRTRSR